jgi:hypothetical protein
MEYQKFDVPKNAFSRARYKKKTFSLCKAEELGMNGRFP